MKKNKFTIFYSWQSYIGGYANRNYIRKKIISGSYADEVEITLLEDSRGTTGAPDIPNEILTKIAQSDIFICDVTPVHTLEVADGRQRALPNPNVMFELGFAVCSLGWERVICICNEEYGSIETLPFDISTHRIIKYRKKDGERNSQRSLSLDTTLSDIISKYDDIIAKGNEYNYKKHDIDIFRKMMSFVSEKDFINSIKDFRSSGRFFLWYEKCWDFIQYFQDYPENRFISTSLNDSFSKLVGALDELKSLTCRICSPYNPKNWEYEDPDKDYTLEQMKDILMTQEYRKRKISYPADDTEENIRKYYKQIDEDETNISKISDNVLKAYSSFRDAIKHELVI